MEWWAWLAIGGSVVLLFAIAVRLGWIDLADKSRRGGAAGVLFMGDEIFAPRKYEAQSEMDEQTRLPAPSPIARDTDRGIALGAGRSDDRDGRDRRFHGHIHLDLSERR